MDITTKLTLNIKRAHTHITKYSHMLIEVVRVYIIFRYDTYKYLAVSKNSIVKYHHL